MGNYSVPVEIRRMKPQGTMVKKIKNRFYVYEYNSKRVVIINDDGTKHQKTKTIMGKCVGYIDEKTGFIPNDNYISNDAITGRDYGDYAFVVENSAATYEILRSTFHPQDADQIYVVALIFFVNGFTHMKNIKDVFDYSYLALRFPDVHVGYDALKTLYTNLGTRNSRVRQFETSMIENSSKRIAIDGHVIACTSEFNDLSEFGYKSKKLGIEQINWLTAYDVVEKSPLFSHMRNGSEPDIISIQFLFDIYQFSNTEFLVDRGFNSKENKQLLSQHGNTYIMPMISKEDSYWIMKNKADKIDKRNYFIFNGNGYASMVYYTEQDIDGIRCIVYQDTTWASIEKNKYIKAIADGKKGYSEEGLLAEEKDFGLFLLETNNFNDTAKSIFYHYKSRWAIETYYNYVRNDLDFNALYQQDYFSMQGLSFIVTISGLIFHDIKIVAKNANLHVKEIMKEMKKIKISFEKEKWVIRNNIKSVRELAKKIGFKIPIFL